MRRIKNNRPRICLDAGHGGDYNQSPVCSAFFESHINWKLQAYLKSALQARGMDVVVTKDSLEADPGLVARGQIAKDCDLFLSLHINAAQRQEAEYVLGIYMVQDNCGEIDEQSQEVAELLAMGVAEQMGAKHTVWTQESSSDRDGNGYQDDYYGVLRGAHAVGTAGVILEHGFYTNPKQARWLMDEDNLKALAEKEASVLARWFQAEPMGKPYMLDLRSVPAGSKGQQVRAIQALLIGWGYSCGNSGIDGSFGPATKAAVLAYQRDHHLTADATVGPATMGRLLGYSL